MKPIKLPLPFLMVMAVMAALLPDSARSQTNAYDDAYHYYHASATWFTNFTTGAGRNEGFGYTPWVIVTNNTVSPPGGGRGSFTTRNGTPLPKISSPTNFVDAPGNNTNAHVWGFFANGSGINTTVAYRGFSNSLDTTVAFKLDWENLGIGSTANNYGGFFLRNGNPTNGTADYLTSMRFAFYYVGGGSNSFVYWDGNGVQYIGIPFASNPFSCEFTLKDGDTYRFVVKSLNTGAILAVLNDQPLAGSGTIDSIALIANQTSGNQNFNRMIIASTSLTPPTIINVQPASTNAIYVDPSTMNVSFEVGSVASTISISNTTLRLNGVLQSLAGNSTAPTNQLLATNVTPLVVNTLYNAVIATVDANGNTASNSFTFNTFSSSNLCIDAEDYNHGGGAFFASPAPNAYFGLLGTNGIDYSEVDPTGTNNTAAYRTGDLPQTLDVTGDPFDHAGFAGAGAIDYEIGFTDAGEWQNYTRALGDTNYTVYARAASGGGNGVIQISRLADATATTTNQPQAALGTCIIPVTGGSKIYSGPLVALTDFFSNPVQLRFSGTNTFRATALNQRAYNLNYLMFVPNTNTATLRPYLSAGYPYPGAAGVGLESSITFTIANRQTAVNPATIQLLVNSNNVTGSITLNNNAAGTVVTYIPPIFLTPNTNYTLTAIFTDDSGTNAPATNTWQFTTATAALTVLPPGDAIPVSSAGTNGFALRVYKVEDAAPTTATLANAEAQLSGTRTNTATSEPYTNLITSDLLAFGYAETNVINYDITGTPTGTPAFGFKSAIPGVAAGSPNNNIALESLMYLHLTNGNYIFVVRSDDGFKLTEGVTPTNQTLTLGSFDGGRGNGTPSTMYVTVLTNGLYPMRLLYFQAGSGGNVEFYSLNNGTPVLINDPTNAAAIKAYQSITSSPAAPVTIINTAHTGNTTSFDFLTQSGHTHYVEYKDNLTDVSWTPLTTIPGTGALANVVDNTASNATRFYRVRSQ